MTTENGVSGQFLEALFWPDGDNLRRIGTCGFASADVEFLRAPLCRRSCWYALFAIVARRAVGPTTMTRGGIRVQTKGANSASGVRTTETRGWRDPLNQKIKAKASAKVRAASCIRREHNRTAYAHSQLVSISCLKTLADSEHVITKFH